MTGKNDLTSGIFVGLIVGISLAMFLQIDNSNSGTIHSCPVMKTQIQNCSEIKMYDCIRIIEEYENLTSELDRSEYCSLKEHKNYEVCK